MDGEGHRVTLPKGYDHGAALHAQPLLGQDAFAAYGHSVPVAPARCKTAALTASLMRHARRSPLWHADLVG
jgi:hypothetical protein